MTKTLNFRVVFLFLKGGDVGGGNGRISLPGTRREQAKRELCLCVLTAEHDAWCEHLYYGDIMKVNLLNTKFIIHRLMNLKGVDLVVA